jgi:NADH-quinone oxidoreductase subunit J
MLLLSMQTYIFLLASTSCCILLSLVIFFSENTIYSVLSLLGVSVFLAMSIISLGSEYMAFVFLMVYAGAVVVLFLFVVFSLNLRSEDT